MDRGAALLQTLRTQMERWLDSIKRSTCATKVSFVPMPQGEFAIRVEWKTNGEDRHHERVFTRKEVFGSSYSGPSLTWRVERRACDYARDCIRQVLSARGVL